MTVKSFKVKEVKAVAIVPPAAFFNRKRILNEVSAEINPRNILSVNPQKYFRALGQDVKNKTPGVKGLFESTL